MTDWRARLDDDMVEAIDALTDLDILLILAAIVREQA